jgi:hypothetical protein
MGKPYDAHCACDCWQRKRDVVLRIGFHDFNTVIKCSSVVMLPHGNAHIT